jgi:fumarate reductase flavoprotein subunit
MSEPTGSSRRTFLHVAAAIGAGVAISARTGRLANAAPATEKVDVVIVGSGLAGLSAALSAADNGAKVELLEKERTIGGDSILATGDIYACCTSLQKTAGIVDSPDAFYKEAMEKSGGRRDPVQTRMIADFGGPMVDWLISQGVQFDPKVVSTMGSATPRDQHAVGWAPGLINTLTQTARKKGIRILLQTRATRLLEGKGGQIVGLEATGRDGTRIQYSAPAVVLATGGFGANPELLRKLCPGQADAIWAASPAETGDGLIMAMNEGADTVDIDVPWLTPTVEINSKTMITSNVLSKGGILLDSKAQRFTNEPASYEQTSQAVMNVLKMGEPFVYEIYDDHVNKLVYRIADYVKLGITVQAPTLDELAQKIGLDPAALKKTVTEYNDGLENKNDKFGREIYGQKLDSPPFGCIKVKPGTIMTPGGLKIDNQVRVVKKDGAVIRGLYAAGEVTGGYRAYGYIGGDSLAQCAVSGMIGGKNAAVLALSSRG